MGGHSKHLLGIVQFEGIRLLGVFLPGPVAPSADAGAAKIRKGPVRPHDLDAGATPIGRIGDFFRGVSFQNHNGEPCSQNLYIVLTAFPVFQGNAVIDAFFEAGEVVDGDSALLRHATYGDGLALRVKGRDKVF